MVLLNLIGKKEFTKDDVTYSISESLRTTRVDELKIPLIFIGDYFAKHWSKKPEEIIEIISTYETEMRCDRITKSIVHASYIPESEKYKTMSQIYSDYIKFLNFNKEEFTAIKNRFKLIHPSFILPNPNHNVFPYPSIKRTIVTKNTLTELLLRQEAEIARLKAQEFNINVQSNKRRDNTKPYLLTYNPSRN